MKESTHMYPFIFKRIPTLICLFLLKVATLRESYRHNRQNDLVHTNPSKVLNTRYYYDGKFRDYGFHKAKTRANYALMNFVKLQLYFGLLQCSSR